MQAPIRPHLFFAFLGFVSIASLSTLGWASSPADTTTYLASTFGNSTQIKQLPPQKVASATAPTSVKKVPTYRPSSHAKPLKPLGWVEMINVGEGDFLMKAKLDTGAETSSIDAKIIKKYKKGKNQYVLFRIKDEEGKTKTFRSRLRGYVKIKNRDDEEDLDSRPVVTIKLCLGGVIINDEINLSDRDHFNYALLVGRNMLEKRFAVDASSTFTSAPECKE